MNLVFDNNSISINDKKCDLDKFNEKDFFVVIEQIVENKDNIQIEKKDNVTPLGERLYEILSAEIIDNMSDLD